MGKIVSLFTSNLLAPSFLESNTWLPITVLCAIVLAIVLVIMFVSLFGKKNKKAEEPIYDTFEEVSSEEQTASDNATDGEASEDVEEVEEEAEEDNSELDEIGEEQNANELPVSDVEEEEENWEEAIDLDDEFDDVYEGKTFKEIEEDQSKKVVENTFKVEEETKEEVVEPKEEPIKAVENKKVIKKEVSGDTPKTTATTPKKTRKGKTQIFLKVKEESVSETTDTKSEEANEDKEKVAVSKIEAKEENKQPKTTAKTTKKNSGKWIIKEKGDGEYVSFLYANNGEVMLTSEIYKTYDGALKGIETIKKNVALGNFVVTRDKNNHYYYKIKTVKNRFICAGEIYTTSIACVNAINSVKKFSESATLQEGYVVEHTIINYKPEKSIDEIVTKAKGKWKIIESDGMYTAELYANNGERLICSEAYTLQKSAKDSIESIKTNALANNFVIDSDKNGRYYFKLRNAQKSTLCIGETYEKFASCESAINSVIGFIKTSELVEEEIKENED